VLYIIRVEGSVFQVEGTSFSCDTVLFAWSYMFEDNLNVSGMVLSDENINICTAGNFSGKIIVSNYEFGCILQKKVLFAQNGGAVAFLAHHSVLAGAYARSVEGLSDDLRIPVLSVQSSCIFQKSIQNMTAVIVSSPNGWLPVYDNGAFWFVQCLIAVLSMVIMIACTVGSILTIKEQKSITTKVIVLMGEGVIHIFNFIISIDMCSSRGILSYRVYTVIEPTSISGIGFPNILMGFFFLALFGNEISDPDYFLTRYRPHFLIFAIICVAVSVIMSVLGFQFILTNDQYFTITGIIYTITNLVAVLVMFLVLWRCYKATSKENARDYLLKIRRAVFRFVIGCIILTILVLVPPTIKSTESYLNSYSLRVTINFLIIFACFLSLFKLNYLLFLRAYKSVKVHITELHKSKSKSKKMETNSQDIEIKPMSQDIKIEKESEIAE